MQQPRGRLRRGLAQSLAIWLATCAALWFAPSAAVAAALFLAGLLTTLLLGKAQRRHPDTATGAYAGAVLWPVVLGATLIAINIISASTSVYD